MQTLFDNEEFVDVMFKISSATATGFIDEVETDKFWYQNQKIELSFDGKPGTHFNSKGKGYLPVTVTYYFAEEQPDCIDYFIYYPRQDKTRTGTGESLRCCIRTQLESLFMLVILTFSKNNLY